MNTQTATKLVISPDTSFESIANCVEAAGWSFHSGIKYPSLVEGEPEFASWTSEPHGTSLSYTYNPVMNLRVLSFKGDSRSNNFQSVVSTVPVLTGKDIERYLGSTEPRVIMLGLFAAIELEATGLSALIAKLVDHSDKNVAELANVAMKKLSESLAHQCLGLLKHDQENHADESTLFKGHGQGL